MRTARWVLATAVTVAAAIAAIHGFGPLLHLYRVGGQDGVLAWLYLIGIDGILAGVAGVLLTNGTRSWLAYLLLAASVPIGLFPTNPALSWAVAFWPAVVVLLGMAVFIRSARPIVDRTVPDGANQH